MGIPCASLCRGDGATGTGCATCVHPCTPSSAPALTAQEWGISQLCRPPPGSIPMRWAGGKGRGRRANSCLVSKGMEKVKMAAKLPSPPAHAGSRQRRKDPPYSHAPHGTCGQSSGSPWCSGSGVSPGPLCQCRGHGASLIPPSCSVPRLRAPSPALASLAP